MKNENERLDREFRELEEIERITDQIREWFEAHAPGATAVIGISGGKDSTVAAALCVRALGKDRVFGVLMPDGRQKDLPDALWVVESLGIRSTIINIENITLAMENALEDAEDPFTGACTPIKEMEAVEINIPPRVRMMTLRAVARFQPEGGIVINTCNRSEDYVGYSTKDGDAAGDFAVLKEYTVHEIIGIGLVLCRLMGIPERLIMKTPADGLSWRTDEESFGFTYEQLDRFLLHGHIDGDDADDVIGRIEVMHWENLHKLEPMPAVCKTSKYWE